MQFKLTSMHHDSNKGTWNDQRQFQRLPGPAMDDVLFLISTTVYAMTYALFARLEYVYISLLTVRIIKFSLWFDSGKTAILNS